MSEGGWKARLAGKLVTADEALRAVRPGDRVYAHGAAAAPVELLQALAGRASEIAGEPGIHLHTEAPAPAVEPGPGRSLRHEARFVGADDLPLARSAIPPLLRSGALPLDVALLNLSPPDERGYCSLGTSVGVAPAAAGAARTVIAQLNAAMPRTLGGTVLHTDQLTFAVPADRPPTAVPAPPIGEDEARIGALVAGLVEDGATLQLGIGAIPSAVLARLGDRRDLGIHAEVVSDGVVDLAARGVVTGARKALHRGTIVASYVVGSGRVYRFVDHNPGVELHPVDYTNDPAIIRCHAGMVAINSALAVDLSGQLVADSRGTAIYGGAGGQLDFARGAALAPGGKAVIALRSTAHDGTISRIVPALAPGPGAVRMPAHGQYVVTEWGIAALHGLSPRERALALIGLAHPAFRAGLMRHARTQGWI